MVLIIAAGAGCTSLTSPLTTETQIRREIKTDYSVSDPEFRDSISGLLGAPLVGGNNVVQLQNGDQIFPAMLAAIRAAQHSINLETYTWSSGKVSDQFIDALSDRARAGVKVHVILDSFGSRRLKRTDVRRMTDAGVKVVRYNPLFSLKFYRFYHRTHRKLLIVDGKIGFIGGVALADRWSGNAERGKWRDTHYRVEGPVVAQMQGVFCENWLETKSVALQGRDYFPELKPAGTMTAQCVSSGPYDHIDQTRLSYLLAIAAARKSIRLAHAYFVPSKLAIQTLVDARKRGVKVEIIIPAKIDIRIEHMATRARLRPLLDAGVQIYEYKPTLYHCKLMIVDGIWATVGSVNFDEKSFRANDEANLNVLDKKFAATLIQSFDEDKSKSRRLTKKDFRHRSPFTVVADFFLGLFQDDL